MQVWKNTVRLGQRLTRQHSVSAQASKLLATLVGLLDEARTVAGVPAPFGQDGLQVAQVHILGASINKHVLCGAPPQRCVWPPQDRPDPGRGECQRLLRPEGRSVT